MKLHQFSAADKIKIVAVAFDLAILLVLLGFQVGVLFRQSQVQLSHRLMEPQVPTPRSPVSTPRGTRLPTADCTPSPVLGTTKFEIENLPRADNGSLTVPADTRGIAYDVAGTNLHAVFVLSPTPQNILVMSTISVGSAAIVTEHNCSALTYALSAAQAASLDGSVFTGGAADSITVFFPTLSSNAGFVFKGTRVQ